LKRSVTALAVHPTGHLLAVGYTDGSIAFWAVDDDDNPLLVRTLDDEDVNVADGSESAKGYGSILKLEPIIKLSWCGFPNSSDPGTGDTALVILGGLTARHPVGLAILWIPVVNLADTSVTPTAEATLSTQDGIRKSLTSPKTILSTPGIVQDFLLIPRSTPHFSGSFDPVAILLLCEHGGGTLSTEAYQFPRSSLKASVSSLPSTVTTGTDGLKPSSSSTEESTRTRQIRLPVPLLNGSKGVVGGRLLMFDGDAYEQLVHGNENENDSLSLKGGIAWIAEWTASDKNLAKVCSFYPSGLSTSFLLSHCSVSAPSLSRDHSSRSHSTIPRHQRKAAW
jgi:syntaxin-binding protein 5